MIRLAISVEGPTEREFINRIVAPHLLTNNGIDVKPIVITTKRVLDGPNHRGGDVSIARVIPQLRPLLSSFDYVTTFYDFYGFKDRGANENVLALETSIREQLNSPKQFIPYVQQYEFESLLFSSCQTIGSHFSSEEITRELTIALKAKNGPEEVNDSRETCPSKRIEKVCKAHTERCYDKVFDGPAIAEKIGLNTIRKFCPRFNQWLTSIEKLTV